LRIRADCTDHLSGAGSGCRCLDGGRLKRGVAVDGQLSAAPAGSGICSSDAGAVGAACSDHGSTPLLGHIGLDVCGRERLWSSAEVDVLRLLADLIGPTAIMRERYLEELARADLIRPEKSDDSLIGCAARRHCR